MGLTVGIRSTPGQVWLTAEATAEKGGWTSVSPGHSQVTEWRCATRRMWIPRSVPFRRQRKSIRFTLHVLPFRWFFYFLLSYSVFLLFCSLFCLLRTVVPVHRFRTYPLLPCLSSGAPCSLRVRLPVPSQALNSIPHSPSPKGFKLFLIWCPFEHSIAGFRVPCSSLLGTVRGCKPKFLVLVCLASEGKFLELVSFRFVCSACLPTFLCPVPSPLINCRWSFVSGCSFSSERLGFFLKKILWRWIFGNKGFASFITAFLRLKIRFSSDWRIGRFAVILWMIFATDAGLGLRNNPNFRIAKRRIFLCRDWNLYYVVQRTAS